jgi:hypothetical protein
MANLKGAPEWIVTAVARYTLAVITQHKGAWQRICQKFLIVFRPG